MRVTESPVRTISRRGAAVILTHITLLRLSLGWAFVRPGAGATITLLFHTGEADT